MKPRFCNLNVTIALTQLHRNVHVMEMAIFRLLEVGIIVELKCGISM